MNTRLHLQVESDTFNVTLVDNPTAAAFVAQLPLTVSKGELNSNKEYQVYNYLRHWGVVIHNYWKAIKSMLPE